MKKSVTKIVKAVVAVTMAIGMGASAAITGNKAISKVEAAAASTSETAPTNATWSYTLNTTDFPSISSGSDSGFTKSLNGVSFTFSGDTHSDTDTYRNNDGTRGIQFGKGTAGWGATNNMTLTASVSSFGGGDKRIIKTAIGLSCASSGGYNGTLPNGDTTDGSATSVTYYSSAAMNVTSGNLTFTFKSTKSNKAIFVKAIYVWYEDANAPEKTLTNLRVYAGDDVVNKSYFDGDVFDPTGLNIQAQFDGVWDTENNVVGDITWEPAVFVGGETYVDGTYSYAGVDETIRISGLTVSTPDFIHTYSSNSVFNQTSASTSEVRTYTPSGCPEFVTLGGYNYSGKGGCMSFADSSSLYLGNNEEYTLASTKKNIRKIIITTYEACSSRLSMTEGPIPLSVSETVTPTISNEGKTLTYLFGGNNAFFKLSKSTNQYVNITSISVYLGTNATGARVSGIVASTNENFYSVGKVLAASDFSLTASWTNGKADTHPNNDFSWTVNGDPNGTLIIGNNTIVVTYGSQSTTFNVVGTTPIAGNYSLINLSNKQEYTKVYDVVLNDGKTWSMPGNQNLAYGLKIGGKLTDATNRVLFSKSSYDVVTDIVITHGTKDTQITVNSLALSVHNSSDDAEAGSNAVETLIGSYVDNSTTVFRPSLDGTTWNNKYFRIVYNLSSSDSSKNYGVVLTSLRLNYPTPKSENFESASSLKTIRGTESAGIVTSVSLGFGAKIAKTDWDAINSKWPITDYGVMFAKEDTLIARSKLSIEDSFISGEELANVHKNSGTAPYQSGDYYVFTVLANVVDELGNLDSSQYGTVYCAAPYIVAGGNHYFFTEMRYSVNTLAAYCLANGGSNLSDTALATLVP